jgi:hypothetical protein
VAIHALFSGTWIASFLAMTETLLVFLSVPYLCSIFFSIFWDFSDPVNEGTFSGEKLYFILISHSDRIHPHIFRDDKKSGSSTDFYPFSLTDRIGEGSFMFADDFTLSVYDFSWFFWDSFFEKFLHADFSDEAQSLTIFAFCIWKSCFFCDFSDF